MSWKCSSVHITATDVLQTNRKHWRRNTGIVTLMSQVKANPWWPISAKVPVLPFPIFKTKNTVFRLYTLKSTLFVVQKFVLYFPWQYRNYFLSFNEVVAAPHECMPSACQPSSMFWTQIFQSQGNTAHFNTVFTIESSRFAASFRRISQLGSAFFTLQWLICNQLTIVSTKATKLNWAVHF